jgi:oligopeptide/dipeptide ABC transporter ATP-binding protein
LLQVQDLTVEFDTPDGVLRAVDGVSYSVNAGETLGVVGESGSGKSVTAQTIMKLLPSPPARILSGTVTFMGQDLLRSKAGSLRRIRGSDISMIFQEPVASLNPLIKVGRQISEAIRVHNPGVSRSEARERAIELLDSVQVPNARARVDEYPHQFSGGMAQRVSIAMAIANDPRLVIADEPTTALDVTVQAQVMRTLRLIREATNASMILITHDLGLVAEFAGRVVVMYAGRVVEEAPVEQIFETPRHPYTVGLISSVPRLDTRADRLAPIRGQPPNLIALPAGCPFHPRCDVYQDRAACREERPALIEAGPNQRSACHFPDEVKPPEAGREW